MLVVCIGVAVSSYLLVHLVLSMAVRVWIAVRFSQSASEGFRLLILNTTAWVAGCTLFLVALLWAISRRFFPMAKPDDGSSTVPLSPLWLSGFLGTLAAGASSLWVVQHPVNDDHAREHGRHPLRLNRELGIVSLPPHARFIDCHRPGWCADVQTNELGFRDDSFTPNSKSSPEIRIALLGDSYVYGLGLPRKDTLELLLERRLTDLSPDRKWKVMNLGVMGFNFHSCVRLLEALGPILNPDMVILALPSEDFIPEDTWWEVETLGPILDRLSALPRFERGLLRLVEKDFFGLVRERHDEWAGVNPREKMPESIRRMAQESLDKLLRLQEIIGFRLIVFNYLSPTDFFSEAEARGRLQVLSPGFRWFHQADLTIPEDGHPTGKANRIFADIIAKHLVDSRPPP